MSKKELLLDYLDRNNGMITYKDCKKIGIPTIYLTRLENELFLGFQKGSIYLLVETMMNTISFNIVILELSFHTSPPFIYRDLQMKFHNILK